MPDAADLEMVRLLVAAGLDPDLARTAARDPRLAEAMGQILQNVVTGLIEVLRARAHIKQQFRLNLTQVSANQNNPLKLSGDANAALYSLFVKPGAGFLTPVEAVDEAFNDIKAHQMAVLAGMRAAFDQMFERFDPEKLQQRFDKGRGSSMLNAINKARYWEEFIAWYADLAEDRERGFQRLFGEEFAKAYEQQMHRIVPRGRVR
jgi:type VI secretion system FHA domain protein